MKRLLGWQIVALWICVWLILAGVFAGGWILWQRAYADEKAQLSRNARLTDDAFSEHTLLVVNHVDAILRAVRGYYLRTGSIAETNRFIDSLGFERSLIDDVYVADAQGDLSADGKLVNVADRDYFRYQRRTPGDRPYIASVELGRISGKYNFRIARRITEPDGAFGGVVIAAVNPASFTSYFEQLRIGADSVVSLLGTRDRRLRARVPAPPPEKWTESLDSQLWAELARSPSGTFAGVSPVDAISRDYVYKRVASLPLVVVVGFSNEDVRSLADLKTAWLVPTGVALGSLILLLSGVSTLAIASRARLAATHDELNALYEKVLQLALYDKLTALPTRTLLADRFETALRTANRNATGFAVMLVDLNHFKLVNDSYGHGAGDAVLKATAEKMGSVMRATDTLCRWGGDEFLILLTPASDAESAVKVGERLVARVAEPISLGSRTCSVTAAIGVACFPANGRTLDELIRAADEAMYAAKRSGAGGGLEVAPPTAGAAG